MRIISKFQDYYDGVQSYGQDMSLVYHRVTEEHQYASNFTKGVFGEDLGVYAFLSERTYNLSQWTAGLDSIEPMILGVCGITFPIVKVTYESKIGEFDLNTVVKFVSSTDGLLTLLKQISKIQKCKTAAKVVKGWNDRVSYTRYLNISRHMLTRKQSYDKFFELSGSDKYRQFSVDNKIVCFSVIKGTHRGGALFTINPCLKDIGGPIVSNPFDTFQNISMFLGGVLGNEAAPMIVIEDKYRVESHGYNKWSFRRRPSKHK